MKLLLTLLLLGSFSLFAQTKYSYGNIDMHGGKSDSLTKGNSSFSKMNSKSSSLFLNQKNSTKPNKDKKAKTKKR